MGRGRGGSQARTGVTVFLTTQYLEEADVLADRVGIIDHGQIVAEGTPEAAEGRDRRARRVEAVPADPADRERMAAVLERFGERRRPARAARRRRAARGGDGEPHATSCARSTPRASRSRNSQLHAADARRRLPRQDRPASLEGAGDDEEPERGGGAGVSSRSPPRSATLAGARSIRTLRQPANIVPAAGLPAASCSRSTPAG